MAGIGKEVASKVLGPAGAELGSYLASKVIPGKRKLKTQHLTEETSSMVTDWAKKHLSKGDVNREFKTYDYAAGSSGTGKKYWETSLAEKTYDPSYSAQNVVGHGRLSHDPNTGSIYMYDDYVFGKQGANPMEEKGFNVNKLERIVQSLPGTTIDRGAGDVQYGGYKGQNPNAQPQIQRLGTAEEMGIDPKRLEGLTDVRDFVPDIERYYTGEGKKRGQFGRMAYDRLQKKESGDWYAGKYAGQGVGGALSGAGKAVGAVADRLTKFVGWTKKNLLGKQLTPSEKAEFDGGKEDWYPNLPPKTPRKGEDQPFEADVRTGYYKDQSQKDKGAQTIVERGKDQKLISKSKPSVKQGKLGKAGSAERAAEYKKRNWAMDATISPDDGGTWKPKGSK